MLALPPEDGNTKKEASLRDGANVSMRRRKKSARCHVCYETRFKEMKRIHPGGVTVATNAVRADTGPPDAESRTYARRTREPVSSGGTKYEHAFVGNAGSAGAAFDRAIARRSLLNALAAAHERRWLPLPDALELLVRLPFEAVFRYRLFWPDGDNLGDFISDE